MSWTRAIAVSFVSLLLWTSAAVQAATPPRVRPAAAVGGDIVRDARGTTMYVVDLRWDAADGYAARSAADTRFAAFHDGRVVNLTRAIEARYGVHALRMTSWTRRSFTAPLSDAQVAALRRDPRVVDVTPDRYVFPSTPPSDTTAVWRDSATTSAEPPNSQWKPIIAPPPAMRGWGTVAINVTAPPAVTANSPLVYVLDTGVSQHQALNVIQRVNGVTPAGYNCGSRSGLTACTTAQLNRLVGCYTHSSMVAGVVGASSTLGGTAGVYPGANLVSVAFEPATGGEFPNPPECLTDANATLSALSSALDWIGHDISVNNHTGRPSVITLSFNWGGVDADSDHLVDQMATIASQTPGAFIAHSAGNFFLDACSYAYNLPGPGGVYPATADGVMVVGAINAHAQPVVPLNGLPGFWKDVQALDASHQPGSNYGKCVDTWAPGDAILTTVGSDIINQRGSALYSSYAYVSGTSLAAPHIAGLAAFFIAGDATLTTPARVEAKLRAAFRNLGTHDPDPVASHPHPLLMMPTTNSASKRINSPYAEMWVAQRCYVPDFIPPVSGCTYLSGGHTDPGDITRNYGTLYHTAGGSLRFSIDSRGDDADCDVSYVDTGFETHPIFAGGPRNFAYLPFGSSGTLPGAFVSTRCPSATLRLAND